MKAIDHVAIVVRDLTSVRTAVETLLGMSLSYQFRNEEQGVNAAFFESGDLHIEILAYDDPAAADRMLGAQSARIDHIAVRVADLQSTMNHLSRRGVRFRSEQPRHSVRPTGPQIDIHIEARSLQDIPVQLVQRLSDSDHEA